jgi:hypothetical protein
MIWIVLSVACMLVACLGAAAGGSYSERLRWLRWWITRADMDGPLPLPAPWWPPWRRKR